MLPTLQRLACHEQIRLERLLAPVTLAQHRIEIHARQHEQFHHMPGALGAAPIGLAQRLAIGIGFPTTMAIFIMGPPHAAAKR